MTQQMNIKGHQCLHCQGWFSTEQFNEHVLACVETDNPLGAKLADPETALQFLFGGKAIVTFKSLRTKTRFTYRIKKSDDGKVFFVSVLRGPENNDPNNYAFIGTIFPPKDVFDEHVFRHSHKSRFSPHAPSVVAFAWAFRKLAAQEDTPELETWHEGRCARCGRRLTVPESIASGYGPECIGRVGQ